MRVPTRPCLVVLAAIALSTASFSAQPPPGKGKGKADAGFGPWLEPGRDEPAGMKYRTFASKLAGTDVSYLVYAPPGYDEKDARRYPVVYFLHGRGGSQTGGAVFASRLDAAIKAGKAPPAFVVGVNGRKTGSWVDTFDGKSPLQSVIVQELIPHIDASFRTIPRREARAIEGFSMGGPIHGVRVQRATRPPGLPGSGDSTVPVARCTLTPWPAGPHGRPTQTGLAKRWVAEKQSGVLAPAIPSDRFSQTSAPCASPPCGAFLRCAAACGAPGITHLGSTPGTRQGAAPHLPKNRRKKERCGRNGEPVSTAS